MGTLVIPNALAAVSTDSLVGYPSPPASAALRQSFAVVRSWIIPTAEAAISTDSLVGYWKFDEGTGTLAADSSGHGNNGTLTNGPAWTMTKPSLSFTNPYALSFDGTDDYVALGNPSALNIPGDVSISLWFNADTVAEQTYGAPLFEVGTSGTVQYALSINRTAGKLTTYSNGATIALTSNTALSAGRWYHAVMTRNGSTSNWDYTIWLDGVSDGTAYRSENPDAHQNAYIGWINADIIPRFNGSIDDVRIYSRALSAGEIAQLAAGNHTTAVWDGSSSTDWETAANWDINAVPDPFTNIIVRDTSNDPKLAASVSGASITIEASSSLDLASFNFELNDGGALKGGGTLKLKGNEVLSNLGNLATTSTGTVLYYGTGSFTSLAAGDNYNNLTINDGLVGYWKFDEGTGTLAADSSGHGNNGTLTNGPTWSSDPTNSITFTNPYALSFDGVDDYMDAGSATALDNLLNGTSNVTVAGWYNLDTLGAYRTLFSKGGVGAGSDYTGAFAFTYDTYIKNNGGVGGYTFQIYNGSETADLVRAWPDSAFPLNQWNYIAVAYSASQVDAEVYVNGSLVTGSALFNAKGYDGSSINNASKNLIIGGGFLNNHYWDGLLDDVRIYNRALSSAEIAALAAGNQPSTTRGTFTLDAALDVNGDLVLNGGTLDTSSSNYGVTVGGSWENNGGVFTPRKGTVTLDGTTSGLQLLSGGQQFDKLTINGAGSTYTLADHLTASGTLALTNGTLDANSTGNFTVRAGTINQTSGIFTPRSGTVILTSSADATATITSTLSTLRIEDSSESGLVGYWKFDEGTNSGAILDSSGYGNTGVRRGGAGKIWSGSSLPSLQFENRYAMQFDGVDDYVALVATGFPTGGSARTVTAWINTSSATARGMILSYGSNADEQKFDFEINGWVASTQGRLILHAWNDAWETSGTPISSAINSWMHVAVTFGGSTLATDTKLYVNGAEEASRCTTAVVVGDCTASLNTSDTNHQLGRRSDNSGPFPGLLDDVRIYNRALSANEIANLARGRYAAGNSSTSTFTLGANLSTTSLALDSGNLSTSTRTLTVTNALTMLRGGGNLTLGSALATLNGGLVLSGSTITGGAGTLDVNGSLAMSTGSLIAPSGTLTVSGNFTMSGGTFDSNGGTITLDGTTDQGLRLPGTSSTQDFSTLRINKSAGSLILGSAISGTLLQLSQSTFSPGSTVVTAQATTIDGGTLTRGAANYNSRTLTLSSGTYNSNGQTSLWSGAVLLSGGTYTASSATQTFGTSLTISGGTYTGSTGTADINGTFTLNSGTFTAPSITLLSGNFTNVAGTFTQGSNLFTLDGNAQTLSGSLTFYDLTKTVSSGTTLFFHAGDTVTVTNTLTLQGAASNTLKLRSTTAATQWKIDPQVTRTVSYIDVQDSWNTNATGIDCIGLNCTDSGNNTNWTFVAAASTGGTGNNRARQRNAAAAGGGGGGGGSVSTGTGATPFVFVPNYAPLAAQRAEAQSRAQENVTEILPDSRKVPAIRDALLARFAMQLRDARKREEERTAAEAAFLEQDARATTEERRFARAQKLARERAEDQRSAPARIAERRGLLLGVLGTQATIYRDVPVTAWFAPYVSLLIEEDIARGYKDAAGELTGEFGVANAVTRAEVLKMALQAADVSLTGGSPRNRSAQGTWAAPYIAEAEQRGISVLTPETDVHTAATRGEVIQILLEVMGFPIGTTPSTFTDVPKSSPFASAIALAAFYGFISGDTDENGQPLNRFRPDDSINRAEVSKIIALVKEVMK